MGGPNSGNRFPRAARATTDDLQALDIRWLARQGALRPGASGTVRWSRNERETGKIGYWTHADHVQVLHEVRDRSLGEGGRLVDYAVRIERTPCHFGGTRPWFLCPAPHCGRRVAMIYGGILFACRRCHDLTYRSRRRNDGDHAADMAHDLRKKLGWPGGLLEGTGWGRPKGMHRKTHDRYIARYRALEARALKMYAEEIRAMGIHVDWDDDA